MDDKKQEKIKGHLLIVEDDLSARQTMEAFLTGEGYEVRCAPNGQTALMFVREDPPELILLDIRLPEMDGFEICRRLKEERTDNIPVIFISAMHELQDKVRGFAAGGVDYVTKPFQAEELLARVETHLTLKHLQKQIEAQNAQLGQEIAEIKRMQTMLRESEEKFRNLAEQSPSMIFINRNGRVLYANQKCEEYTGYTTEELYAPEFDFMTVIAPEYRELFQKNLGAHMKGQDVPPYECALVSKTEKRMEAIHSPRLITYEGEHAILGVVTDITARKGAEEKIKRVAEEWRTTFDSIKDPVSIHDKDFRIVRANKAFADILGMEIQEVIGKKCFEIIHGTEEPLPHCPHGQTLSSGKVVTKEVFEPHAGRYLQVSASPILKEGNEVIGSVHIVQDVTERKQAQKALQRAHDELEEGVKERTAELATANKQLAASEKVLQERLREIEQLKVRLERENVYLQEEIKILGEHSDVVGHSLLMKKVLAQVEQVAQTDSTVLVLGETGTGKEVLARSIHRLSRRKDRALVTVNCASLPPTLIESELFGRERGAYTGALTKMVGRFEIADGSTLFLDEIGEIPLELQSKLLRVLEEGNFERLGSAKTLHVDVRIIAATNRDIAREVKEGRFRTDLYYRLNVFPIMVPPLRQRPEDIPLMVWAFVKEFQKKMGKEIEHIPKKSMEALQSYSWPGNVRELRNVIEHSMIMSSGTTLVVQVPKTTSSETAGVRNLEEMERRHILSVLERNGWRVGGKGGAAEILGLKRSTLYSKMKKLGITRPSS